MDKKNMEKTKLLQECYYLTRLIQEHNNGKKTMGRDLPRQGTSLYSSTTVSKYQKINTNKNCGSNFLMPVSSNVLLKDKTSVHKTWINSQLSSNKPAVSRDLKDSVLQAELPNTQKHCMYFNPNFLKTSISELHITKQRLSKPKSNQNEKKLIHINPKALIHMVYSDLQKEKNCNLKSERLVTVDNIISCKKYVQSPSLSSNERKMSVRSNSDSGKITADANSLEKHEPSHVIRTDIREITDRSYSFCSDTKLVRNNVKRRYRDTSNSSIHSRNLQPPLKLVNISPAHSRSLRSWECRAFKAKRTVDIKAMTSSSTNAFKCLGRSVRRNSLSVSRRRTLSSSSASSIVKAAKQVCSKYKITRTSSRKRLVPNLCFSVDSHTNKNRLKKVKTYSLRYESPISRKNITFLQAHQKKLRTSGAYHNQNSSRRQFSSKRQRNKKVRIVGGTEQQRSKNGMHSISHLSLVRIGGVLYRSSKLKLARSITPKEKTGGNKILRRTQTKSGSHTHRCIVHVRGNAFLMDSTGKTLQRIRKNSSKPSIDIKNPSPLKRVDIGGVTYIQKSANVLIRTNTHKARSLLSQAKQRSIAMLTNKMRKSNQTCIFYHRFGTCSKFTKGICPHIHDPKQIAVCRKFLQGICDLKNCVLSHEVGPEKMPTCRYFLEGCCVKDSCPYLHVKVNPKAEICKNFLRGYCVEGQKCRKRHIYSCPDFENGKCSNGKYCPYRHKNVAVGKGKIKKTLINKSNPITKEKLAQKRYYQEEEQKDSLALKETDFEGKTEEDFKEHKSELEVKRIKILQKVDLMKKSWQNSPSRELVENMGNQNMELSSKEFSSETVVERPKLGALPAFIPIG